MEAHLERVAAGLEDNHDDVRKRVAERAKGYRAVVRNGYISVIGPDSLLTAAQEPPVYTEQAANPNPVWVQLPGVGRVTSSRGATALPEDAGWAYGPGLGPRDFFRAPELPELR